MTHQQAMFSDIKTGDMVVVQYSNEEWLERVTEVDDELFYTGRFSAFRVADGHAASSMADVSLSRVVRKATANDLRLNALRREVRSAMLDASERSGAWTADFCERVIALLKEGRVTPDVYKPVDPARLTPQETEAVLANRMASAATIGVVKALRLRNPNMALRTAVNLVRETKGLDPL